MVAPVQPADLGFFSSLAACGSAERGGARTRHQHARGEQAARADGDAPGRHAGEPHHAAHEPHARGRAVRGARAPHPRRNRRHGAAAGRREGRGAGPAARERHAGFRPQPRGAADLEVRTQASTGGSAAAALGQSTAADRRRLRRLHPLRRAARGPRDRAAHRVEPAAAVRFARLPGARRAAQGAQRPHAPPLHRHPPGRRGLWHLAAEHRARHGAAHRGREDARCAQHQRRRNRGQLGPGRPRHPDARRVGHRALPAQRPAGSGAGQLPHARRRHLRGVPAAPPAVGTRADFRRLHGRRAPEKTTCRRGLELRSDKRGRVFLLRCSGSIDTRRKARPCRRARCRSCRPASYRRTC